MEYSSKVVSGVVEVGSDLGLFVVDPLVCLFVAMVAKKVLVFYLALALVVVATLVLVYPLVLVGLVVAPLLFLVLVVLSLVVDPLDLLVTLVAYYPQACSARPA